MASGLVLVRRHFFLVASAQPLGSYIFLRWLRLRSATGYGILLSRCHRLPFDFAQGSRSATGMAYFFKVASATLSHRVAFLFEVASAPLSHRVWHITYILTA
jgi:hypothetical protein